MLGHNDGVEIAVLLVALAVSVLAFTALADRLDFPAPLLLIAVGVVASYVPGVPEIHLEPEVVLLGLLPPLLYAAAIQTSLVDFNANRRAILLLSVGLVVFTTFGVGAIVHALIPGISWPVSFAIGAVVAPPDAVAATAVARRIGLPRRIVTILEGESLLNDATALVALRTAIAATSVGVEATHVAEEFLIASVGGGAIGFVVFVVVAKLRKLITDPVLDTAISFVVPFGAFIAAEEIHASGVIAVVVAGLLLGHKAPVVQTAQSRIAERTNWRTIAFVLENTVFLLIGLQAGWILDDVTDSTLSGLRIASVCAAVLVGCIVMRIVWVFAARYLLVRPGPDPVTGQSPPWTFSFILGWAGIRGVVTLAAAFLIPEDTPHREVLLLIAFTVVAGTLFLQGLSLPMLARRLRVPSPDPMEDALARATLLQQASKAGFKVLQNLEYDDPQGVVEAGQAAHRAAQLRRLGAVGHAGRRGDSERALRARPAGDARGRAHSGAGDPRRRPGRERGRQRGAGDARRRGVDDRRRAGQPRRAEDRVLPPAAYRRLVRPPRVAARRGGRAGTVTGLPAVRRRRLHVGLAADLPGLRADRLLRLVGDAARDGALPRDPAPGHAVGGAAGGLALVLRAPRDGLTRVGPQAGGRSSAGGGSATGGAAGGGVGGVAGSAATGGAGGCGCGWWRGRGSEAWVARRASVPAPGGPAAGAAAAEAAR